MKLLSLRVALILSALFIAFIGLNYYIRSQKLVPPTPPERYEATLTGTYVCLPHRDASGPQTLECAFGLKTEVGEYYALDFNSFENGIPPADLRMGEKFTAEGTITPIEMLSTDYWQKYNIEGIFTVSEDIQKIN